MLGIRQGVHKPEKTALAKDALEKRWRTIRVTPWRARDSPNLLEGKGLRKSDPLAQISLRRQPQRPGRLSHWQITPRASKYDSAMYFLKDRYPKTRPSRRAA